MDPLTSIALTCAQASLILGRLAEYEMPARTRNDIVWEIKQITPKQCKSRDANAD